MKIPADMHEDLKRRYQAVRADSMIALRGLIYEADETTGDAVMIDATGEKVSYSLGNGGLRIIDRHVRRL